MNEVALCNVSDVGDKRKESRMTPENAVKGCVSYVVKGCVSLMGERDELRKGILVACAPSKL